MKENLKEVLYYLEKETDYDKKYDLHHVDMINKLKEVIENNENNNYRPVILRDSCNYDNVLGEIYLNNKHSIQDFQNAINKAKEKRQEDIYEFGDDWSIISEELGNFDYFEVGINANEDYVVF